MAAPQHTVIEIPDADFSRLEASLAQTEVVPRDNSIEMKQVSRHTEAGDLDVDELDFDFMLNRSHYPLDDFESLQDVFPAVQHEAHSSNPRNFSEDTQIKCFDMDGSNASMFYVTEYNGLPLTVIRMA